MKYNSAFCCANCKSRTPTCHATCKAYAAAKAVHTVNKAEAYRRKKAYQDANSVLIESRQRFKRQSKICK